MKKTTFIQLFATIALGSAMITACSGDDGGGDGGSNYSPASSKIGTTGKALAGFGNLLQCTYGADGVPQKAYLNNNECEITINGSKDVVVFVDGFTSTFYYTYNKQGYITKMQRKDTEGENEYTYTYSNDRLVEIKRTQKKLKTEEKWDYVIKIEWQGGRVVKSISTMKGTNIKVWNGSNGTQTEINTYSYPTTPVKNTYAQPTLSFTTILFFDGNINMDTEIFKAMANLFGKGMTELPSRIDYQWNVQYDDDGSTSSGSSYMTFDYGLNSDGTIAYETINGTKYNYSYTSNFGAQLSTALPQTETMIPMATAAKETSTGLRHYEPIR
ncbi:MAG: hypothetical protein II844_03205 [Prevotella sp.]|nr:hypothetical protein [Prevotella sp.]